MLLPGYLSGLFLLFFASKEQQRYDEGGFILSLLPNEVEKGQEAALD